ncbi:MAG: glycosyltransferase family 2 protein [Lachnospiraceae bacterium]|nr:glycosyltransferase family 2 protein [Lachnospiraceae bacterium]
MVSIIVPVFNAEKYIIATVKMVLAQTFTDWELILVDDCSTDESIRRINEFLAKIPVEEQDKVHIIRMDKNSGAARARNAGLEKARGQYLAFLDSDDIWLADKLEKQLDFINKTKAAFTCTAYEFGDKEAQGTGKIVSVPPVLTYRKALSRTTIFTSTTLFDLTKIDKKLLKMPDVKSEDTATWWQILRNGYTAYGLNEVTTIYRRPPNSLSANKLAAVKRIWYLYRNVEKLTFLDSVYNFALWAIRATLRRI